MKKFGILVKIIILLLIGIFIVIAVGYGLGLNNILKNFANENRVDENNNSNKKDKTSNNTDINVALTMDDKIENNTVWCGTFQLIWNDLKNNFAKQDIEFTPQLEVVKNLNKGQFNTSKISDNSYYKAQGIPTEKLKAEIEKGIKDKFNETSDILDGFDFDGNPDKYLLYAMLIKEFKFNKQFEELENGQFGAYENVKYFGTKENNSEELREQIQVLYYKSRDEFAVKLLTKQNDEIIIAKGIDKDTFNETYKEIQDKQNSYDGEKEFLKTDTLKIPNIDFKTEKEFKELENKPFKISDGNSYIIEKAIQTIQFELDKTGGKIKSEAGMGIAKTALIREEPRDFSVDNTFTLFLKENDKDMPYFAAKIENINQFQ